MTKKKLSVVLATFNEEKNLPTCLDAIRDLADEIVIVDGNSTDRTQEIAREFGAKLKVTTNKSNFHINKQMAIDMATCEWILQLDADEVVSAELKKEIKKVISGKPEFEGFWMPRKNFFLGRFLMKGGQYPDYTLRLYKKGKGKLPQKDVHEQAVVEGRVGYLKDALQHFPYESFSAYIKKWNKYNNFAAEQIKEEQKSKNILEKVFFAILYLFVKPSHWFLTTYIRHKGFVDGWQGFVFSFFSALRFPISYIKYVGTYKFCIWLIVLLATFLRFYNFPDRWGLGGDDARDAMIALEAIKRHQLPLMGPFSSAGPFVFGGIYYWFIMLSYLALPFTIAAPWILLGIVSILTVILAIKLGKEVEGEGLGIILGLLAATSPQLVDRAFSLGPHTFIATFAIIVVLNFLLLWRTKRLAYAFIMGIFIGLGISFHYQAINLLIFLPAVLFVTSLKFKEKVISFTLAIIGFILPSLPLLYWDSHQGFANIRNIADYLLIAQYRIYVPNSWRIFLLKDLPGYFSFVVGRFKIFSLLILISSGLLFVYKIFMRSVNSRLIALGVIFALLLILNRYYHAERSEGYLLYFVPFILLFSSWLIEQLIKSGLKYVNLLGLILLFVICLFNLSVDRGYMNYKSPAKLLNETAQSLYKRYPNSKFSIYDYKYRMYGTSTGLSLIVSFDGREDPNGHKIGVSCYGIHCPFGLPILTRSVLTEDLSNVSKKSLGQNKSWVNVNQESAYNDLIGWLNKDQLKSTFSFGNYLKSKLKL